MIPVLHAGRGITGQGVRLGSSKAGLCNKQAFETQRPHPGNKVIIAKPENHARDVFLSFRKLNNITDTYRHGQLLRHPLLHAKIMYILPLSRAGTALHSCLSGCCGA